MKTPTVYTIEDAIKELKRELGIRKRLYPEWIPFRKNGVSAEVAAERIGAIEVAIKVLEEEKKKRDVQQTGLFV